MHTWSLSNHHNDFFFPEVVQCSGMIRLVLWFSNITMHQNDLEDLLKRNWQYFTLEFLIQ